MVRELKHKEYSLTVILTKGTVFIIVDNQCEQLCITVDGNLRVHLLILGSTSVNMSGL